VLNNSSEVGSMKAIHKKKLRKGIIENTNIINLPTASVLAKKVIMLLKQIDKK